MSRDVYPSYSKTRLNKSGKNIRDSKETEEDIRVIENWRASHNHILNTWQANLRRRISSENREVILAQRLKRRVTIFDKLKREPTMAIANMHDIAGCRLIFKNLEDLEGYRKNLHEKKRFRHVLYKGNEDPYNYVKNPRDSGYRGIHDVYLYKSSGQEGEKWDGLKVELQYRTIYQHAWATAVEIAQSLTGNQTKFNRGSEDQKEFFRLTSEIISRAHEGMRSCYPSLTNAEVVSKFHNIEEKIHLLKSFGALGITASDNPEKGKALILKSIQTSPNKYKTEVHAFDSLPEATKVYFEWEKLAESNEDLVLVRSISHESIRDAYRNYFSDTGDFVKLVNSGIIKLKN